MPDQLYKQRRNICQRRSGSHYAVSCGQCGSGFACASAQSDQQQRCTLKDSTGCHEHTVWLLVRLRGMDSVPLAQSMHASSLIRELHGVALRSDCGNGLADLELNCPPMANVTCVAFNYRSAHTVWGRLFASMDEYVTMPNSLL